MQRDSKPDGLDLPLPSPQLSRTQSRSSDRDLTPSVSGSSLAPAPQLPPEPAYIASSAAAHVVNSELVNRGQNWPVGNDVDEEDAVAFSQSALALINSFLDQLLFSFLTSSRSTSILSLRPAISEILKPRLAKEAIEGADEELGGYLAGGDDEELLDFHNGLELKGGSNLHQVFRRTRLRCMVYTRLGDMEEEDEEAYLEASSPSEADSHRLSRELGNVSPAAAIFLTSIIEFIGEQALVVAGDNAFTRVTSKKSSAGGSQRLVVDERDVEKIAFNKTLGRLWRSWKRRGRMSSIISLRSPSHEYHGQSKTTSQRASRATSVSEAGESTNSGEDPQPQPSVAEVLEEDPASPRKVIPRVTDLPTEPDFSTDIDSEEPPKAARDRPRSMVEFTRPSRRDDPKVPAQQNTTSGLPVSVLGETLRKSHQRSSSFPTTKTTPYSSPINETFTTPTEGPDPLMKDHQKSEKETPHLMDGSRKVSDMLCDDPALSTVYNSVLKRHSRAITTDRNPSSREVSLYQYSDKAGAGFDKDTTSQAPSPSLKEPKSKVIDESDEGSESRPSTSSSGYSFQGGEKSPLVSTEGHTQTVEPNDVETKVGTHTARGDSLDNARVGPERFPIPATEQGDRLQSHDERSKAGKRNIPVLHGASANEGAANVSEAVKRDPSDDGTLPTSTITNSQDVAQAGGIYYEEAFPPRVAHIQPTMAGAKIVDIRKHPAPLSARTEKAAVQRVSLSSPVPKDLQASGGRVSTSSNRDGRPVTAGSSTSVISTKIKGIIVRESGDVVRQPTLGTTSSEITRQFTGESSRSGKSTDKEQDFEQLIRSNETIQYTLTPQNMREIEEPDSPRWSTKPLQIKTADIPITDRSAATTDPHRGRSISATRSMKSLRGLNGLKSNPTQGSNDMKLPSSSNVSPTANRSYPQPTSKSPDRKLRGIVARQAASESGSLRDFADFIRSTGPENDARNPTTSTSNKPISHSRGDNNSSQHGGTKPVPKKITTQSHVPPQGTAESTMPVRTSSKLKARDPIASATNTTADLANFLRSGPPDVQVSQRSVSSPQSTGRMRDGAGSSVSQDSFAPSKMTQSSSNSRTGLLENTTRGPPAWNNSQRRRNDDPQGPVRKQHRVLDPYAIDSDDEDGPYGNPPELERKESLSDFLRNYTPPPTTTATGHPQQTRQTSHSNQDAKHKQRKGSTVSMRERLARNIAVIPDYRPLPPKTPKKNASKPPRPVSDAKRQQAQGTTSAPNNSSTSRTQRNQSANHGSQAATAPQLPPLKSMGTAGAASPHLISQTGNNIDSPKPTQPAYAKHLDRRPKQLLQARDETGPMGGGRSGLADLANFLKETEPPAPSGPDANTAGGLRPMSPSGKKEASWGAIFARRKKTIV